MKNFVDYGRQDFLLPSLFVGYVHWPYRWQHTFEHSCGLVQVDHDNIAAPVEVELPEMIAITEHQTSGHMCHHLQLFGVFFHLNDLDLYREATRHGYEDLWAPVPWKGLVDWTVSLKKFGLQFEHTEYRHTQEAFMPFGGESAWKYAKCKNLTVLLPTGGRGEKTKKAFPTFESLQSYLHDAYEKARTWNPEGVDNPLADLMGCIYEPICGAVVYENCD